ncbi:MAG: hypothetical protein ACXWKH_19705, partial [Limisphaerales bacterium]
MARILKLAAITAIAVIVAMTASNAAPTGKGGGGGAKGGGAVARGGGAPLFSSRPSAPAMARPSFSSRPSFSRPAFAHPSVASSPRIQQQMMRSASPRIIHFSGPSSRGGRRAFAARTFGRQSFHGAGPAIVSRHGVTRLSARQARIEARAARRAAQRNAAAAPALAQRAAAPALATSRSIGTAFAARQTAHAGWYRNWRRHHFAFGWFGPLFWPYAYDSIFNDVFWPYAYDYDPFWDYGYGDIYSAMFNPYSYDELVDVPLPLRGTPRTAIVTGSIPTSRTMQRLAPLCGDDSREVAGVPVDTIQTAVVPDEAQRATLDELGNAAIKAAEIV